MEKNHPQPILLKDYTPPDYFVDTVNLRFQLGAAATLVDASLTIRRNILNKQAKPLVLDGQMLELLALSIDGRTLDASQYKLDSDHLTIADVPAAFVLEIKTRIYPQKNTALEGLYESSGNFCTQCEAEGFRKITYFLDRPDVLARYQTTITANQRTHPILLSNGNLIAKGELADGQHWVTWEDPHPKPCYLFALVAGDLRYIEDRFTTRSKREVTLQVYVEPNNIDKCDHAMRSLKKAMAWDEVVFGLEYDLDMYMIVAVDDFNMGAMENKGLNVFNSQYVLAKPATATDQDYANIEGVIAHEYFHNWTGNRVTCRDWFQLSLKEGLTVFRDQLFSADMSSAAVTRIQDVRVLRTRQFPEDAGPMAHSVRPESYIEINNFYTTTIYNKGAEVIRMLDALIGRQKFCEGLSLYLTRHDGQAATTEDFVQAMTDVSGKDFTQFRHWYSQAGTPQVHVSYHFDAALSQAQFTFTQHCQPTPKQDTKLPFHIPFKITLFDSDGGILPLLQDGEQQSSETPGRLLELCSDVETLYFNGITTKGIPSLLQGFSAPVQVAMDYTDAELAFLLVHDTDLFNRWEAGQILAIRSILQVVEQIQQGHAITYSKNLATAYATLLADTALDKAFVAEALTLPSELYLAELMDIADVDAIHQARQGVRQFLATSLYDQLLHTYHANCLHEPYVFAYSAVAKRSLQHICLAYLMTLADESTRKLCMQQFLHSDNMTDEISALGAFAQTDCLEREEVVQRFFDKWQGETLVVNKWLTIQATSKLPDTLTRVKALMKHPAFAITNPNKVRALIGAFCYSNPYRFHAADGAGYQFLGDRIIELNAINPQVAARMVAPFTRWQKYDLLRQQKIKEQLSRIVNTPELSSDVFEIASKSLA